ncbi:TPA: hypothetical protein QCK11_003911 [Enterobacter asburiae]|uniref:hypothetical protein n=1 Tax=Enterobacter soli TaxID=885040 RepID=UPI0032F8155F|nr:hypothetical protein [Enterobacter asburiae]HDR2800535.1 hypothetical protein [Enterobacter asburiae]HDR2863896.1 hypothetical protein [Enterobacter asburiae]
MALISCLTSPDGQQDVFSCLSMGQGLGGFMVLIILLVGWLVIQYLAEARRTRLAREAIPGIPVPPAQFGNARHAAAVHDFANRNYYQVMLAEMEKALFSAGYELTQDASRCTRLANADSRDISRKVTRVRYRYMTPLLSEQMLNDSIDDAMRNGSAAEWLSLLIRGSEREGWYITRTAGAAGEVLSDRQKCLWPLRQVMITLSPDSLVITRDLVQGLNAAADAVSNTLFPEIADEPHISDVPVTVCGLQVTLIRQLCSTPPGFFPDESGSSVPAELFSQMPELEYGEKRIVVFAQITSAPATDVLARFIRTAGDRIAAGEDHAADYDDDNGYAFIVLRTSRPH